jgi:hypothetical protein
MIKDEEIETDLDFLTLPPDMAPEGETFEFRFGGPDWKRGFRYGKVWLYDGDFVGRLSETTEVRIPATWIRAAVDELVATLAWGRREQESKAVIQDVLDDVLDRSCYNLIWHRTDDGEPDPATFARVRNMICFAAFRRAAPKKPLSEIVVGYHVLNAAGDVTLETTRSVCACDHAFNVEKTGFAGVGVVFADGSVHYDSDLVRLPWLPWPKPSRKPRAAKRKRSGTRTRTSS